MPWTERKMGLVSRRKKMPVTAIIQAEALRSKGDNVHYDKEREHDGALSRRWHLEEDRFHQPRDRPVRRPVKRNCDQNVSTTAAWALQKIRQEHPVAG